MNASTEPNPGSLICRANGEVAGDSLEGAIEDEEPSVISERRCLVERDRSSSGPGRQPVRDLESAIAARDLDGFVGQRVRADERIQVGVVAFDRHRLALGCTDVSP